MSHGVLIFAAAIAALGLYGLAAPDGIARFATQLIHRTGLWVAVGVRALLAVLLWFAAPESQTPTAYRALAAICALAAIALPPIGIGRVRAMLGWWVSRPPALRRAWGAVAVALGAFLFWSSGPALGLGPR